MIGVREVVRKQRQVGTFCGQELMFHRFYSARGIVFHVLPVQSRYISSQCLIMLPLERLISVLVFYACSFFFKSHFTVTFERFVVVSVFTFELV